VLAAVRAGLVTPHARPSGVDVSRRRSIDRACLTAGFATGMVAAQFGARFMAGADLPAEGEPCIALSTSLLRRTTPWLTTRSQFFARAQTRWGVAAVVGAGSTVSGSHPMVVGQGFSLGQVSGDWGGGAASEWLHRSRCAIEDGRAGRPFAATSPNTSGNDGRRCGDRLHRGRFHHDRLRELARSWLPAVAMTTLRSTSSTAKRTRSCRGPAAIRVSASLVRCPRRARRQHPLPSAATRRQDPGGVQQVAPTAHCMVYDPRRRGPHSPPRSRWCESAAHHKVRSGLDDTTLSCA
jgi:hypothetical protein